MYRPIVQIQGYCTPLLTNIIGTATLDHFRSLFFWPILLVAVMHGLIVPVAWTNLAWVNIWVSQSADLPHRITIMVDPNPCYSNQCLEAIPTSKTCVFVPCTIKIVIAPLFHTGTVSLANGNLGTCSNSVKAASLVEWGNKITLPLMKLGGRITRPSQQQQQYGRV